jgi:hypothetical protein
MRCFRGCDRDTDQNLLFEKVRESLSVTKQAMQKFAMETFYLKKLNKVVLKEECGLKTRNLFQTLL